MGTWVSKNGVQVPARERVALTNEKGEPYIYEGEDRSAKEYLEEQGVTSLGRHWSDDPEIISRIRQIHNCSLDEYKKMMGYDEKTSLEEVEKNLQTVNTHSEPRRKNPIKSRSGGANTAGSSGHYEGDFGDLSDAKSKVK
jgi:hypothetical protein